MKTASKSTILPPSSEDFKNIEFPKPPRVPEIKMPTEEELARRERDALLFKEIADRLLKQRKYEDALSEMEHEIEEYEASKKKTIPIRSNLHWVNLIKSCNDFYSLCIKK